MAQRQHGQFIRNCALALFATLQFGYTVAQENGGIPSGKLVVSRPTEDLSLMINTSKLVEMSREIKQANVQNDQIITVRPMSSNQLMFSARATGVTQVDLIDENDQTYSVLVSVTADARELQAILRNTFPGSVIEVTPINNGVIITGHVKNDLDVADIERIAALYYPEVINRIQVLGERTVMLHTQVLEVSRTKLRELGIDWQFGFGNDFVGQSLSVLGGGAATAGAILPTGNETFRAGILNDSNSFFTFIRALRQNNLVKVMADPTVVAIDGRPASFNSGGEFPIVVPAGLGQVGIEFREFGTRVDFVAKVRDDSRIHLEVRPTISEVDPARSVTIQGVSVPGLRSRFVETAVELDAGQTLALAGLLQVRTETQSVGLPGLADLPYVGAAFRSNQEVQNEVELLITVTPDFAAPLDPGELPANGPGFNSSSPTDKDFYLKGYIEVPNTCEQGDCAGCSSCSAGGSAVLDPVTGMHGHGALNQVLPSYETEQSIYTNSTVPPVYNGPALNGGVPPYVPSAGF